MSDRPIECSHCKKTIKVIYKEIAGHHLVRTEMCSECPVLQQRLYRQSANDSPNSLGEQDEFCSHCGTTLAAIKTGNPLGCSACYTQFESFLISELHSRSKISPRLKHIEKTKPGSLHQGRAPGKSYIFTHASRLIALNEALEEALKRENYEQAAWLRDQIKHLKDHPNEGQN